MSIRKWVLSRLSLAVSQHLKGDGLEADIEQLADRVDDIESTLSRIEYHLFGVEGIAALDADTTTGETDE